MKASSNSSAEKRLSPFDFIGSINEGPRGKDLLQNCYADSSGGLTPDSADNDYVPFIVNRSFSFFPDTVLFANAMNEHAKLPAKMQFDFYRFAMKPRKRFSKWAKKSANEEGVKLIMEAYDYNEEKARDALKLFTPEALSELKTRLEKGGLNKKK